MKQEGSHHMVGSLFHDAAVSGVIPLSAASQGLEGGP